MLHPDHGAQGVQTGLYPLCTAPQGADGEGGRRAQHGKLCAPTPSVPPISEHRKVPCGCQGESLRGDPTIFPLSSHQSKGLGEQASQWAGLVAQSSQGLPRELWGTGWLAGPQHLLRAIAARQVSIFFLFLLLFWCHSKKESLPRACGLNDAGLALPLLHQTPLPWAWRSEFWGACWRRRRPSGALARAPKP